MTADTSASSAVSISGANDPDELAAILALEDDGFPAIERWSAESWQSELTGASFSTLVARTGTEMVGVIALRFAAEVCELDRIIVAERRRRQGIGRQLIEAGLQTAALAGAAEMTLEVRADNIAAIELYRGLGFRSLSVRSDYYGPGRDAMIMKLSIGGER